MYIDYLDTPLGDMEIQATDAGIAQVIFCGLEKKPANPSEITRSCREQLKEYFSGQRKTFELPLDTKGTAFQKSVWGCLQEIPFGQSLSYGEIADMLDNPKAVRAVGGANGRNPLTIIVPCHRVIGASGTLTGYAGGVERKLWLLKHEGFQGLADKETQANGDEALNDVIHRRQDKTQFLK
ncbi:methylated-DNA--[protein]-cysteine S-methyltransferase [Thalassomonas actiniarum]|uniref:Methylated-DNA--protein-cysteine methyltransferase n=1 Tax=Thalassomonas actiniarum TaxID=485447 RepID=A0AAE9YPT4_9GAMM|nr:methylated-DNA--[protein]-cysteine S-methyltransferase [Thalassomonas actiniarum]WDD98805.1 methylated-DNA--[protein]-cysteine S-methyltransferase [Thalassomonas actiniarum]